MLTARHAVIRALQLVCIALFAVLVLVVLWQVISRQLLGSPSSWTTTVASYLFVWLTLFGFTLVFGERGHVAVELLAERLPVGAQKVLGVIVQLTIALFAVAVLVVGGIRGIGLGWSQAIPGIPVSIGQMYLAMPIAGVLITLFALDDLVRIARGLESPTASQADADAADTMAVD